MSDVYEALSRLLSGDLPEEEARVWARRIAEEPDVAAAWATLQHVTETLADTVDVPPPAHLDERVLGPPAPVARAAPPSRGWAAAGWLVAAAAVLAILWPRPVPEVRLVDGSQWVDGEVRVHAADTWVEVDGAAMVVVEPPGGVLRVPPQEDPMNATTHIAAAVAGAIVTVAVYEGTAWIMAPDEPAILVSAGETRSVGEPVASGTETAQRGLPIRVRVPLTADEAASVDVSDPEFQIAALQAEIDRLKFERDLATGQLAHTRGEATAWPDKVDPMFQPEVFEQRLTDALESTNAGEIVDIDCNEYPCIAYVELDATLDQQAMRDAMSGILQTVTGGEDVSAMQLVMQAEGGDGTASALMGMAVLPEDDEAAGRRVKYRSDAYMEDWSAENVDAHE